MMCLLVYKYTCMFAFGEYHTVAEANEKAWLPKLQKSCWNSTYKLLKNVLEASAGPTPNTSNNEVNAADNI